jgi:hypothetical protein
MPHRVSPTGRIRGHIDELFAQQASEHAVAAAVTALAAAEAAPLAAASAMRSPE